LLNINLKEERFFVKTKYLHESSGKAVQYWMDKENIPLENILITDDLNLSFGTIHQTKGSDGGHNGLKNISA
jgi:PTH1 family peptidyl-tRNA hydrolase